MPLVSIIVPNYNHAQFLARRLESILNQSFQDYELIILDDASTDGSRAVIARYRNDNRVRYVPNERNSGSTFAQWNRGADLARGELIWFAESDDFSAPTQLEALVAIMQANARLALAYCQSITVDANDRELGSMHGWTADLDGHRWEQSFTNDGRDECRRFLLWKCTIPNASAVLLRRRCFHGVGGACTQLRLCGDWMTWARLLMVGDIAFTPQPLNYFRAHQHSQREQTGWRAFVKQSWIVERFILRTCGIPTADRRRLAYRTFYHVQRCLAEVPAAARPRELWVCLLASWPIFASAPETTAKLLAQQVWRKTPWGTADKADSRKTPC